MTYKLIDEEISVRDLEGAWYRNVLHMMVV